jgi:hypothetical protein
MFKILILIFVEKKYKIQHLEGSGTHVLYIGRTVLKVKLDTFRTLFRQLMQFAEIGCCRC